MVGPNLKRPGSHGVENVAQWEAGTTGDRPLVAVGQPPESGIGTPAQGCWRISLARQLTTPGQVDAPTLDLTWGAGHASRRLTGILLPAVLVVPGFATVRAVLGGVAAARVIVTANVTTVYTGCCSVTRTLLDASLGAVPLPPTVVRLVALVASTVTPLGAPGPIAVAAGAAIDVQSPGSLTTGVAYAEHEL